jgi:hypothetical protein
MRARVNARWPLRDWLAEISEPRLGSAGPFAFSELGGLDRLCQGQA